jgi:hypothetical protein
MKTCGGVDIDPRFLDLGTSWWGGGSALHPGPFTFGRNSHRYQLTRRLAASKSRFGQVQQENILCSGCPIRSQSLYRLRCPSSKM